MLRVERVAVRQVLVLKVERVAVRQVLVVREGKGVELVSFLLCHEVERAF